MIYEPWHYYNQRETACALQHAMNCRTCGQMAVNQSEIAAAHNPPKRSVKRDSPIFADTKIGTVPPKTEGVRLAAHTTPKKAPTEQVKVAQPAQLSEPADEPLRPGQPEAWHQPTKTALEPNFESPQ
jgi:hypothetical protein